MVHRDFRAINVLRNWLKMRYYYNHLLLLTLYYLYQFFMFAIFEKMVEIEVQDRERKNMQVSPRRCHNLLS